MIISTDAPASPLVDELAEDTLEAADLNAVEEELREFDVPVALHGQRLDKVLADLVPEFSRNYLQQLADDGAVRVNGVLARKSASKLRVADHLSVLLRPTPQSLAFKPEQMHLDVVYQDADILVVNKPAGLVVHPAAGHWSGTLLNGLLAHDARCATMPRAGIVHRLDKDTSGLMVVARTRQAMDLLVAMIAAREVSRKYIAIAHRAWMGEPQRTVDAPIGRDIKNRLRMAVVDLLRSPGKLAVTDFDLLQNSELLAHYPQGLEAKMASKKLARTGYAVQNGAKSLSEQQDEDERLFCLLRCTLHSGRTHQIRVHAASIMHPLVGDSVYGGSPAAGLNRQALHAYSLGLTHPMTGEHMHWTAPLPADLRQTCDTLGLDYSNLQMEAGVDNV